MISKKAFTEGVVSRSDVLWHAVVDDDFRYSQSRKGRLGYALAAFGALAYAVFKYRLIAGSDLRISGAELANFSWLSWLLYGVLFLAVVFSIGKVISSLVALGGKPIHWGSQFKEYAITPDALYLLGDDEKYNLIIRPKDIVKIEIEDADTKNYLFIELSIHFEAKGLRFLSSEIRLDGVKDLSKAEALLQKYFMDGKVV